MVSPKRSLSPDKGEEPEPKRARLSTSPETSGTDVRLSEMSGTPENAGFEVREDDQRAHVSTAPSLHSQARQGIQRSLAMVLQHDGFESATPGALEGFTQMVETYMESLLEEAKLMARASRREHPVPMDFERMLKRYNVPISALKPHIKHPMSRARLTPSYTEVITLDGDGYTTLPILAPELSGQPDKDEKTYIPKTFPEFPSKHTYKFTPQEDVNIRDSQKIREQAAKTAQQGEDALRRLVRASKMRKQKEVKSLVEKDHQGRERYRLWESTMKKFMGTGDRGDAADEAEVADHSMIVNSDAAFARKEVSRLGKRSAPLSNGNLS